jgi:hypothetical protein
MVSAGCRDQGLCDYWLEVRFFLGIRISCTAHLPYQTYRQLADRCAAELALTLLNYTRVPSNSIIVVYIKLATVDTLDPFAHSIEYRLYPPTHKRFKQLQGAWSHQPPAQVCLGQPRVLARVSMGTYLTFLSAQLVGRDCMQSPDLPSACEWWRKFFDVFADPSLVRD